MKELYYIRGDKKNPESVKQALLDKGGINNLSLYFNIEDRIYYIDKDSQITFADDYTQLGKLIISFGTELQLSKEIINTKKLYYVKGNVKHPERVEKILLKIGGKSLFNYGFNLEDVIYYVGSDNNICYAPIDSQAGGILLSYGIELKLEEIFEPGDKVLVSYNGYWELSIYSHTTPNGQFHCCGLLYDECHHYEPWMKKYLGTDTPWKDMIK